MKMKTAVFLRVNEEPFEVQVPADASDDHLWTKWIPHLQGDVPSFMRRSDYPCTVLWWHNEETGTPNPRVFGTRGAVLLCRDDASNYTLRDYNSSKALFEE